VGCAPWNAAGLRGVAVATCSGSARSAFSKSVAVLAGRDACLAERGERVVVTWAPGGNWTVFWKDGDLVRSTIIAAGGANCLALAVGSAVVAAQRQWGDVEQDLVLTLLQASFDGAAGPSAPGPSAPGPSGALDADAVLPPDWRRERAVALVPAGGEARLHVRFERTGPVWDENLTPTVGLDDLQLLPLLSQTSVLAGGALAALVAVPSRAQLAAVGLAHLLRGASPGAPEDDDASWERVHATAALDLGGAARSGCVYALSFWYEDASGGSVALPIGCALQASSAHVRGAWAQCMLELPALALGDTRLRVRVAPENAGSSSSSAACALEAADSVLVFLDAHAALFECAGSDFLAGGAAAGAHWPAGQCTPCREGRVPGKPAPGLAPSLAAEAALCGRGRTLAGCPALTARPDKSLCRNCTAPEVEAGRARFEDVGAIEAELDGAEPCKWRCHAEYFELGEGRGRRCAVCGEPLLCGAGLYWKNCSRTEDSMCAACPELRVRNTTAGAAGEYAANEEYVEASGPLQLPDVEAAPAEGMLAVLDRLLDAAAGGAAQPSEGSSSAGTRVCRSRCKKETFRHADGRCKRCWSRELVLEQALEAAAGAGPSGAPAAGAFFAVAPCAAGANTAATPCEPREGSIILGHDPAETGDCPRGCEPGWRVDDNDMHRSSAHTYARSCVRCAGVTVLDAQSLAQGA
jgi:hypothetical protein